jgi:cell cycle arrest protein BUB3
MFWDPRSENDAAVHTVDVGNQVFCASAARRGNHLVVGTAERMLHIFDLRKLGQPVQSRESSLKNQTRTVCCMPNDRGFVIGSVDGRVAVEYFDDKENENKYAFKCHREKVEGAEEIAYPVNAIAFHPVHGTFATAGSDRTISLWDGESRKKLSNFHKYPNEIASMSFDCSGKRLAIACSYTFDQGERADAPKDTVLVRSVNEDDFKPKPKKQ